MEGTGSTRAWMVYFNGGGTYQTAIGNNSSGLITAATIVPKFGRTGENIDLNV